MRKRMPSARRAVEFAAENEQGIPELFGIESPPVGPPEEMVPGIDGEVRGMVVVGQPIGARGHDGPMHLLDRPPVFHELPSQVIEQRGVCWRRAANTKVARCRYETSSKVIVPDAVDHDARSERVVRMREPVGQLQSATAFG